uniref:F-box domain-containing protein n=1 Tax=Talaromyces marneffei PM1 TaxID=1077442 RepID=A0A093UMT0_TALMA
MQFSAISSQSKPTLEGLPTELIILILFYIPDQTSLQSIVFASPIFHQAYLAVRQPVLYRVLKTQYESLLNFSEAITAVQSEGLSFHSHNEDAISLLDIWRRRREIAESSLTKSDQTNGLNGLEETIKIFANIFGLPERDLDLSSKDEYWNDFADIENENKAYSMFYGTTPPWEYEEMGCVWSYLMTKYEPVSKEISNDLRKLVDDTGCFRFWQIVPEDQCPPIGCHLEIASQLDRFNVYFDKLTSIEPSFLYRVLHAERLLRRNMVMANARIPSELPFIGKGLGISWDYRFSFIYPADRHEAPNFQQLWSTLPAIEQPNLGWKKAWLLPNITEQERLEDVSFYDRLSEKTGIRDILYGTWRNGKHHY